MSEKKYAGYIMTELDNISNPESPAFIPVLRMNSRNTPAAFQLDFGWFKKPFNSEPEKPLCHNTSEIAGFFGSDPLHPHDLGGEIEFWLEDKKFVINRSSMLFIPSGLKHSPFNLKRIDRPIIYFSTRDNIPQTGIIQTADNLIAGQTIPASGSDPERLIVSDLHIPEGMSPEFIKKMEEWNHLILWIDDKLVPGAFQMNCCWFDRVPSEQQFHEHRHSVPEIIGLLGSDPADPHNMGASVEFWMEDEKYLINRSCLIYVPAGVKHCPLYLNRVDRPIFHFTVVASPLYSQVK